MQTYLHNTNIVLYTHKDHIGNIIHQTKQFYEIDLLKALTPYLTGTVIDVGANIGNHSIYFATQPSIKRVLSIEAHPHNVALLRINKELNKLWDKQIIYYNAASSVSNKQVYITTPKNNMGASKISNNKTDTQVNTIMLDDLQNEIIDTLSLIKIDVEGHELEVLKGAKKLINKYKPILSIELNNNIQDYITHNLNYQLLGVYCNTPTGIFYKK